MAQSGTGSDFVDLTVESDDERGVLTGPARLTQLFQRTDGAWSDDDDAEIPTRSRLSDTIGNLDGRERAGVSAVKAAPEGRISEAPRQHARPIKPPRSGIILSRTVTAPSTSTNGRGLFKVALNGDTDEHRQKRRKISSHTNAGLKLKNMNGGLTRHSLQAGLKSGGVPAKIPADLVAAKPHSLLIPRESSDEVEIQRANTTSSLEETTLIAPRERERELHSSDLDRSDEEMLGEDELDRFWKSYCTRTSESSGVGSENRLQQEQESFPAPVHSEEVVDPSEPEVKESEFHLERTDAPRAPTQSPEFGVQITNPGHEPRKDRRFREEDNGLLVYLKEVKGLGWTEIRREFPDRTKGVLNTHYCRQIKGMNWMASRLTLKLPPKYAAEAAVLWPRFCKERGLPVSGAMPLRTSQRERTSYGMHAQPTDAQPHVQPGFRPPGRPYKQEMNAPVPFKTRPAAYDFGSGSGSESAPRQGPGRPKRNVASVNYTWPRRHRGVRAADDEDFEEDIPMDWEDSTSWEHLDSASVRPDVVLPVQEPLYMNFDSEDARLVTSQGAGANPPYLSSSQRKLIRERSAEGEWDQLASRKWQGTVVHVDFRQEEMETVETALRRIAGDPYQASGNIRKRLRKALSNLSEPKLLQLPQQLRRKLTRDQASVHAFLQDAAAGKLSASPTIQRIGAARVNRAFTSSASASTSSLLRQRESGLQARRGWKTASRSLNYQFKNNVYDTLGPTLSYTGASSDVNTVAWSPDGLYFAAGAVCVTDPDSMQYNRPNNLLYGDMVKKSIHELPKHREERKKPESGPNSTHEMHVTQDPSLYFTVSSVAFSADGNWMFSASYDRTVMAWQTRDNTGQRCQPKLFKALEHKAPVDIIAVNQHNNLATASKRWKNAIKVCTIEGDRIVPTTFSSRKAKEREDLKILPTALRFEPSYGRLLLAGFGANKSEDRLDTSGDICLWDVETQQEIEVSCSTLNMFDVAWAPNYASTSVFAAGCVAGGNVNRGTRSLVRLYDGRGFKKRSKIMEVECPALDMNDVVFCPYDVNLIAAGCTSGSTYVWDLRRPDQHLYRLDHGNSLMPLPDDAPREVTDTGVRFLAWGDNATRLYTGSSDGVVKVWDVARSHQDVFIKDLVTFDSGIMCGTFSPDKSRLVLGEVNGSINVLEVGNEDRSVKEMEKMTYVPYEDHISQESMVDLAESGRKTAVEIVARGEIVTIPFGGFPVQQAVQGPNYNGPFDGGVDAPYLREQALEFQLSLAKNTSQGCSIPSCRDGLQKVTAEEVGDSGRSADRIPDELHKAWSMIGSEQGIVPGRARCQNPTCGRLARPKDTGATGQGDRQLCERCQFACFRCSGICKILHPGIDDKVVCQSCLKVWEIGALGYKPIDDGVLAATVLELPVPSLRRWERAAKREEECDKRKGTSWGDDLNALSDYYFGLTVENGEE